MFTKWQVKNFRSIYDIEYRLRPLSVFYGMKSQDNRSFFESLTLLSNFSDKKYNRNDFFYKNPNTDNQVSYETNINFTLAAKHNRKLSAYIGFTLDYRKKLFLLSSFITQDLSEIESLFIKYYKRASFEYLMPGKTFYKNKVDADNNLSMISLNEDYLLDPYSANKVREVHYPDEDYKKTIFTFPLVEAKNYLPEKIIYPDIESVRVFKKKCILCDTFLKLLCEIPCYKLKTRREAIDYTEKMLKKYNFTNTLAHYLLDLLVNPHTDFYPNCLASIFNFNYYFSEYKCSNDDYYSYCISFVDWYRTLSCLDTEEQAKIISKIQNDINCNCSDIRQCLYNGFQNDFQLNEAESFDLPFHLKKAKEYIECFFKPKPKLPAPCINFIMHLPYNLKDDIYIEEIRKRCLLSEPFSSVIIIEPEAYLGTYRALLEFTDFISLVIQNDRQIIIQTDSQTIINKINSNFSNNNNREELLHIFS